MPISEEEEANQNYSQALEILAEIAGRSCEVGELVFAEGDPGTETYFIVSGAVTIFIGSGASRRDLMTLVDGDIFGEMALLDHLPRSASVEATQPTRLVVLERKLFYHLVGEYPILAQKVIELMGRRMRNMDTQFKAESGYTSAGQGE